MSKSLRVSILVGIALALFGSAIWWYEIRPYLVRRSCAWSILPYEQCIHAEGLEK